MSNVLVVLRRLFALSLLVAIVACRAAAAPASPTASPPLLAGAALTQPIRVVAAENFYGDVATQIGGDRVSVVSILSDPSADPHEYESNADDARAVANAQVLIKNSLGYDAFLDNLMAASPRPNRVVVDVSEITGHAEGDNPHVWYDPATMPRVATRLAAVLTQLDPTDQAYFAERLQGFLTAEQAVDKEVAVIRGKYAGTRVLSTEPVFDYMAKALGLNVVDKEGAFQKAVEEGNDPPAAAVAAFRTQLASHNIKVLISNSQAVTPLTTQMKAVAEQNNVAVVSVSETEPAGMTYQKWLTGELGALQAALGG